jgi:hypothetical protein
VCTSGVGGTAPQVHPQSCTKAAEHPAAFHIDRRAAVYPPNVADAGARWGAAPGTPPALAGALS